MTKTVLLKVSNNAALTLLTDIPELMNSQDLGKHFGRILNQYVRIFPEKSPVTEELLYSYLSACNTDTYNDHSDAIISEVLALADYVFVHYSNCTDFCGDNALQELCIAAIFHNLHSTCFEIEHHIGHRDKLFDTLTHILAYPQPETQRPKVILYILHVLEHLWFRLPADDYYYYYDPATVRPVFTLSEAQAATLSAVLQSDYLPYMHRWVKYWGPFCDLPCIERMAQQLAARCGNTIPQ